jgi:pyridoxal phosphate enzyme (YggS family)
VSTETLTDRLAAVRVRIAGACRRAGRDPLVVTLVAVTKTVPADLIRQAVDAGLTDFGENRVQEAREKQSELASTRARWHLIGHLQRNKAKDAVTLFDVIHSVDSTDLAQELQRQAATRRDRPLDALVQVNVSGEASKFGCAPVDALSVARAIGDGTALRLSGLMAIAPFADDPESARPHFRRLRQVRDEVASALGRPAASLKLSMGMSGDFEVAIEEGADLVRVGTALFGARPA